MGEIKRFGQVDYDEIYYIYDKTRLKQSYEELLESYKDEEYAEEMAKDDYFQQALTNSLNGDEVVDLLNQLNDENTRLKQLADGNEEQLLKVMSYLHDNHYDLWEKVNKECF